MAMPGLFVSGTDTGVGKTVVTAALAELLRSAGRTVRVCKPVATDADGPVAADTRLLAAAADDRDYVAITPWSFDLPAAPPVAARAVGVRLDVDVIALAVQRRMEPGAILLVEGVGGLLCPLTETAVVADLVERLRLPLLIVARLALGTLNHTLLTLEAARSRGLEVFGVVLSETTPATDVERGNLGELRRLGVPVLAVLSWGRDAARRRLELTAVVERIAAKR
jgi:dethiobiotin synthetase